MPEFHYTVQGTADERPNAGVIEATSKKEAEKKLNEIYGITDTAKPVVLKFVDQGTFNQVEAENNAPKDVDLTHRPE